MHSMDCIYKKVCNVRSERVDLAYQESPQRLSEDKINIFPCRSSEKSFCV